MSDLTKLGKFEIRRELGRGAMGVVYEGFDPMIERSVAIKTIRADNLQGVDTQDHLARFRREAQAAGRLTHPNIVSIYDFGQDGDTTFIAMEYVKGRELLDFLKQGERFDVAGVVSIMSQLLDALDYSHRNGVVHRDIKPANIILLADGTVKVADFGIARVESSNLTQVGTVMGTPSYMSPEQFMGQTVDGRSDLFSAGVILYQLLTAERPFTGSVTTIMHKVLQEQPLPPSTLNVQIPQGFDAVIEKALAKRPDQRYQTGAEFAGAIREACAALAPQDSALAPPVSERTVASTTADGLMTQASGTHLDLPVEAATAAPATPSSSHEAQSRAARSWWLPASAVLVLTIGAVLWWRSSMPPSMPAPVQLANAPEQSKAVPPAPAPAVVVPTAPPGTVVISALGVVDPADPRFKDDRGVMEAALRADARGQLVQKTLRLFVQRESLAENYDRLNEALYMKSGDYVLSVAQESAPQLGKDGLMYIATQGVVKSRQLQKSLNQMSVDERISFIRTSGDPKISVRVSTRDADNTAGESQPSPVAENLLKERIKSFGFRTWAEEGGAVAPDFSVSGEARIKKLSAKLPASGLTITKYTLSSWTVKCTDRTSGEDVYVNTTLPKGIGSWASEEEALAAIGERVAAEFSRDFFLQHFAMTGQGVVLKLDTTTDPRLTAVLERELSGLGGVLRSTSRQGMPSPVFDLQVSGAGSPMEVVTGAIVQPLNGKLGQACFAATSGAGNEVTLGIDRSCTLDQIINRLESTPPAGLYEAPAARQRSVIKNPETLKKLTI